MSRGTGYIFFNVFSVFLYFWNHCLICQKAQEVIRKNRRGRPVGVPLANRDVESIRGSQYKIHVGGALAFMVLTSGQNIVTLVCVRDLKGIFLDRKGLGSQTRGCPLVTGCFQARWSHKEHGWGLYTRKQSIPEEWSSSDKPLASPYSNLI